MTAGHKRVLITGAAGAIGSTLRTGLRNAYHLLRVSDVRSLGRSEAEEEAIQTDLTDFGAVRRIVEGIDCVVHLGGVPREDSWDAIRENNIAGTYNLFEASAYLRRQTHRVREL
jgi:uronate dehydrogenase